MTDRRLAALEQWVSGVLPGSTCEIRPASADASFRRYFRITTADRTFIAMDAPPPQEDCRPFVHVAQLFRAAGVNVPAVHAQDIDQGFLLLDDLGARTYGEALDADTAPGLYSDATDALVRIQSASRPGALPEYDEALLLREMRLFPEWYIGRHLGVALEDDARAGLEAVFAWIVENNLAQARVHVHRDYHSRNLMVCERNPGILDFQDAVHGPVTYDLVSLFKDAYVSWDEERLLDWTIRYWEKARRARLPVPDDFAVFYRDFEWMGVQRHVKVLGIFARLWHRDGKDRYLADMPRVMNDLRKACARYVALDPLLRLLDRLEGREARAGYTF